MTVLIALLVILVAALILVGAMVVRALRAPIDLVDLRDSLLESVDVSRNTEVNVSVPVWAMTTGRVVASLTDVPEEIQTGLDVIHSGYVGVYELAELPDAASRGKLLKTADTLLSKDAEWTRAITVLQEKSMVVVYVKDGGPETAETSTDVFLVALDQRELVVVSARARNEPLCAFGMSMLDRLPQEAGVPRRLD